MSDVVINVTPESVEDLSLWIDSSDNESENEIESDKVTPKSEKEEMDELAQAINDNKEKVLNRKKKQS